MKIKRWLACSLAALLAVGGLTVATAVPATATYTETCIPSDAWTEITPDIFHPAVGEPTITVDNPDYVPAVEASTKWWNFAPNDRGPFEGVPTFPTDPNGVWVGPHTVGGPSQDLTGVFQQGEGNGSWFNRVNVPATPAEGEPTIEVPNPDYTPAYTEVVADIEHPAVVCPPPGETYVTALWEGGSNGVLWPEGGQTLVGSIDHGDKVLNTAWINSQTLKDCTTYQGDLYVDDATTASLLAGGKLYGEGNPTESWPGGSYQEAYSTVFTTDGPCSPQPEPKTGTQERELPPVCVDPADGNATVVTEERDWTRTAEWNGEKWVYGKKVFGEWEVTNTETVPSADCAPVTPEPKVTTETGEWTGGEPTCEDTEVTQTSEVTTTTTTFGWEFQDGEWVETSASSTSTVSEDRTLTWDGGPCPVVTPTPTPTPTETSVPASADQPPLAETGGILNPWVPTLGALLLALGALAALGAFLYRRRNIEV